MGDLLLAALAFAVLMTLGLTALAGLSVVPFVLALQQGEARGRSPGRVGAATAATIVLGLGSAGLVVLTAAPVGLVLPALALTYAVPLALRLGAPERVTGRAGRHE